MAWGNGQLSDADYLNVLKDAIAATDPDTTARATAQNKYDDAVYTIGRANVQNQNDPNALIAFDQSSLAKMQPGNQRYSDLKNTLDAELANKRSTDYSKIVDQYNLGKSTTQSLIGYVTNLLATLPANAPDKQNWQSTLSDLTDRAQNEKDSQVFQDYQQNRIKPEDFVAYLTQRRDSYFKGSPQYQTWDQKLEDTTTQITTQKQSDADSAFFNDYNAGKKTDADYVGYIRTRLAGMTADDPSRADWQNRLDTATFSIAEDQLRLEVSEEKRPASDLVSFYTAYQRTLQPNSPEYRSIQSKIDAAKSTDFSQSESQIQFKVQNHLLPISALVDFYTKSLGTFTQGTSDWRSAYDNLQNAKQAEASNDLSILNFGISNPGVNPGSGLVSSLPDAPGYTAGATSKGVSGASSSGGTGGSSTGGGASGGGTSLAPNPGAGSGSSSMESIASAFIQGAGGVDSPEMRKAVEAWMYAEGVTSSGARNNPWNLHSPGAGGQIPTASNRYVAGGPLPGQTGSVYVSDKDKDVAVFGTAAAGVAANARNLNQNAYGYPAVKAALAANNPAGFLKAMQDSGWAESQYKGTPGQLFGVYSAHFGGTPPSTGGAAAAPVPSAPGSDTATPAQASPDKQSLVTYWQDQVNRLQEGTPEWRAAYTNLQQATADAAKPDPQAIGPVGKAISPKDTLETVLHTMAITPDSTPFAVANYQLNQDSLNNAWTRGDKVWLFVDPANPNATTYLKNPDGSYALDADGKKELVRGSGYFPVTGEALARLDSLKVSYYQQLSEQARAAGQNTDAAKYQDQAIEALDGVRLVNNKVHQSTLQTALNGPSGLLTAIDHSGAVGDLAGVLNTTTAALSVINQINSDPSTDDTRKGQLDNTAQTLANHALLPDPASGRIGAIDFAHSVTHKDQYGNTVYDQVALLPGNHLVFKMENGQKSFDVVNEDLGAPGEWEQSHVTVHVQFGDKVVTAESKLDATSPISPILIVNADGKPLIVNFNQEVRSTTFFDGSGNRQTAYSVDNGQTWIRPNDGQPPMLEMTGQVTRVIDPTNPNNVLYVREGMSGSLYDPQDRALRGGQPSVIFSTDAQGNVTGLNDSSGIEWFGQADATSLASNDPFSDPRIVALINSGAPSAQIAQALTARNLSGADYTGSADLGAPGSRMTLAFADSDGSINMLPPDQAIDPYKINKSTVDLLTPLLLPKGVGAEALRVPAAGVSATASLPGIGARPELVGRGTPAVPVSSSLVSNTGLIGVVSQLPPTTPPRIAGAGALATVAIPPKPIAPIKPVPIAVPNVQAVASLPTKQSATIGVPPPLKPPVKAPTATTVTTKPLPSAGVGAGATSAPKPNVQATVTLPKVVPPKPVAPTPIHVSTGGTHD